MSPQKQQKSAWLVDIIKLTNIILMSLMFFICWVLYYNHYTKAFFALRASAFFSLLYMIMYGTYTRIYGALNIETDRISELVYSQGLSLTISDVIIYFVIWLLQKGVNGPNVIPLLIMWALQLALSAIWSFFARHGYISMHPPKKTLIVYDMREGIDRVILEHSMQSSFDVRHIVSTEDFFKDMSVMDGMEAVFLSGVHSKERNIIIKKCVAEGKKAYVIPRVGDMIMAASKDAHILHLPIMKVGRRKDDIGYALIKRSFDIIMSLFTLIVASPIMLITAVIIKATDGGPVFYKQCRLTKNGKRFNIIKFRSMRVDAEKDGVARLSTGDKDDRITPIGRFIRKVRIDELPQLINILMGDMSIVGPRPERPEIAAEYEKEIPEFALRLQVKAGLTGYAQVYGKYNTTPYDKLLLDLNYIAKAEVTTDIKILFATVKILFMPESTEGVSEGATTAMEQERGSMLRGVMR